MPPGITPPPHPQVLSSPASAALLERALLAVGGVRTGGPPKLDPVSMATQKQRVYGYAHMDAWDLLWSITAKAMLAAEILRPGEQAEGRVDGKWFG